MFELLEFSKISDERGNLVVLEGSRNIPFEIQRVYYIWGANSEVERGFHAHKKLKQVAVCLSGHCDILFDNGEDKEIVRLDKPFLGVTIDPMIWHEMKNFSADCIFMVLASEKYDEDDYIRNYNEFQSLAFRT